MTERRRAEDHTFIGLASYYSNKYSILWIPAFAVATAIGFDFKTPAQQAKEFGSKIAVLDTALQFETRNRKEAEQKIDLLLKLACVSSKLTTQELQMIGLNCSKILGQ